MQVAQDFSTTIFLKVCKNFFHVFLQMRLVFVRGVMKGSETKP